MGGGGCFDEEKEWKKERKDGNGTGVVVVEETEVLD